MIRFIYLLICFSCSNFTAQMLNNEKGNLFSETPFFNEKYIRSINLKSITGTISSKKELGSIKASGNKESYIFNKKGHLLTHYLTTKVKNKYDTIFTFYEYKNGNNTVVRVSDSYGFYSYSRDFDSLNRIVSQAFSREKNASKSKVHFKLEEKYIIFEETYKYHLNDSIHVVTVFNSNGRPYQIQKKFYNQLGYLEKTQTRLLISNKNNTESYQYNEKGFLKSIKYFKEQNATPFKEIKYDYDEWGNVTFMDEYKDNERVVHKELLYNPSNLVLKTILSQDLISNLITITKFESEFYN